MGDGAVANSQSIETQARWIASLMAQGDGPAVAQPPAQEPQPTIPGDRTSRGASRGNASPTVSLQNSHAMAATGQTAQAPQRPLTPPPPLFTNEQGQVVTNDGQPYLGLTIYQDPQSGVYHDGQGHEINLEAEELRRGIGNSPEQPAAPGGAPAAANGGQEAVDPNTAMVDYSKVDGSGRPQVVYPNGEPYLGRELFVDEASGAVFDKEGKSVDPATLGAPQGPTPEEQKLSRRIQQGTALASGAFNVYMNRIWYNSTAQGMAGRLQSMQRSSSAFKAGTSLQSKMANTPVVGNIVNRLQVRREGKIDKLQRNLKLVNMTPKQEAMFMAKERLATLKAESAAFKRGEGMLGRMKNAPVVGNYAKKVEANRQVQIRQVRTQIKSGTIETTWKNKVANATRGRILPGLMALGSGWSTYTEIRDTRRRADDPTNVRKWDDYTRIAGGAIQTGGALMALKRGNVKGAIITATAGTVISTVGEFFRD
jgi:hypothetical protein